MQLSLFWPLQSRMKSHPFHLATITQKEMEAKILSSPQNLPLSLNKLPTHDPRGWNALIKHHAKLKRDDEILCTHARMEASGVLPDAATIPIILKACGNLQALDRGKRIHRSIECRGLIGEVRLGTSLVDFYCKCGCFEDAVNVFDKMTQRDVVAWNAMIMGCVECSEYEEALLFVTEMQKDKLRPNSRTVVSLILACGQLLEVEMGKEVHAYSLRNGLLDVSSHVGCCLIGFYARFDVKAAFNVFHMLNSSNSACWNAMITAYFDDGHFMKCLDLFKMMLNNGIRYDFVTLVIVIRSCEELLSLNLGTQLHQIVIKSGISAEVLVLDSLMNMYAKMGNLQYSSDLFASSVKKDIVLWNSIISMHVESGFYEEAFDYSRRMIMEGFRPNERTVSIMSTLFHYLGNGCRNGRSMHGYIIKCGYQSTPCVRNGLISMYMELNCAGDAFSIFDESKYLDIVSWNTYILKLANHKLRGHAYEIFRQMQALDVKPNSHTLISILAACDDESYLRAGRSVHAYAIKQGFEVERPFNNALTEMYMNCSDVRTAEILFESLNDKDVISWNAMMCNYVRCDQAHKAIITFHRLVSKVQPSSSSIINAISACSHMANLSQGLCLHAYMLRRVSFLGYPLSIFNAVIHMYARCGCMHYAENVFKTLPKRNAISWNALISGYGMNGRGSDAVLSFSQMLEEGLTPSDVTFISVLSACSHSGLVEKGMQLYDLMVQSFYITPKLVHYACIVDLLARGGRLDEAMEFISSMPITPDGSVWRALLGACRVYAETKYVKYVFEKLLDLEPGNAGNYILASNIYAAAGLWSEVKKLRALFEANGVVKPPGKSWIVVRNELHQFIAGDKSHPQSGEIYRKLHCLLSSAREKGYVPDLRCVLHDEDDVEKIQRLSSHSEKLAIAFGLISVRGGTPILITKNLRVCGDCHEFSKHISRIVGREIILRDTSRFHHFIDGVCSCKDYW